MKRFLLISLPLLLLCSALHAAPTAYVANLDGTTVTPIDLANNTPGDNITVGTSPLRIAITFDNKTAYVSVGEIAPPGLPAVVPIDIATNVAGAPIFLAFGASPQGLAITPDNKTVYVTDFNNGTVIPIDIATNTPGAPIVVATPSNPVDIAISHDGKTGYVVNAGSSNIRLIDIATNTVIGTISGLFVSPSSIAITPDDATAYITSSGTGEVFPINLATNIPGAAIAVGASPIGIAITPDGKFAYAVNSGENSVSVIDIASNTLVTTIMSVGNGPIFIAITPDGKTAYVTSFNDNSVIPIDIATNTVGASIPVGPGPYGIAITHLLTSTLEFTGRIHRNIFLNKTEFVLIAQWPASSSSDVALYRVYNGSRVIATISPVAPLRFITCIGCPFDAAQLSLTSVDTSGNESEHAVLRIVS